MKLETALYIIIYHSMYIKQASRVSFAALVQSGVKIYLCRHNCIPCTPRDRHTFCRFHTKVYHCSCRRFLQQRLALDRVERNGHFVNFINENLIKSWGT